MGPPGRLTDALDEQRVAWQSRPLVRSLYRDWHRRIDAALSPVAGESVELGAGFGSYGEHRPGVTTSDVEPTPWAAEVLDAERLDRRDGTLANLVLIDVLHHLPHPLRFLAEAERVLAPGGRVVMVEPYCSPVSAPFYRFVHFEGADLRADPFAGDAQSGEHPLEANNALATLIFWRGLERFRVAHPSLAVVARERFAPLLYPLSGGFTGRRLVPAAAERPLRLVERLLSPVAGLLAFRCLVVLEKRP